MPLVVKDRVKETTTTTGTGTLTLAGVVTGFQAFSVIGDGNTTYYTITDATNFEVGVGTYTLSGTTLSRDTILESSNSGSAVNFSAGSKEVFVTYPAERAVYTDAAGTAITPATASTLGVVSGGTGAATLTGVVKGTGTAALTAGTVNLASEVTGTLPVGNGGTGITSFGTGVATFLGTPSSANLAAAVTNETGSGSLVFATSPTLVTPILGTPQSGTLTNCTFPTLNQNTTGSAATWTTARTLSIGGTGKSVNGSGDATWTIAEIGINTTNVLNATAGASLGAVGTYAWLGRSATGTTTAGDTIAGADLRFCGVRGNTTWQNTITSINGANSTNTPSGTWMYMAQQTVNTQAAAGVWLRIS